MNPLVFRIGKVVVPPISWALCRAAGHGRTAWIESYNKIQTIETVEFANTFLGGDLSVEALVARIQGSDPFRALWLGEGLGLHLGVRALADGGEPRNLLTEGEGSRIPDNLKLMAHAGMSLAFARHHLDRLGKTSLSDQIRDATKRIAALIGANSIAGYSGIGYEAWGMVTRFFYGKLFPTVVETMRTVDPVHVPHLWHGAGRASYFIGFMPRWREPWPSFAVVDREARDPMSRANLLAGLASAMVIVNMKTPEILEAIIREKIAGLPAADAAAFSQGIECSMVMRQDTTPNEEYTLRLVRHVPARDIENLWERVIGAPSRHVLETLHPLLRGQRRLDEVTCYKPTADILSGLPRLGSSV